MIKSKFHFVYIENYKNVIKKLSKIYSFRTYKFFHKKMASDPDTKPLVTKKLKDFIMENDKFIFKHFYA